jgi:hypothetical protein
MSGKTLTVEQLKRLPFRLKIHMNGGEDWSGMVKDNEEYGLVYSFRTNGRPEYKCTERSIATNDGDIVWDMLDADFEKGLARFVEKYNERALCGEEANHGT